MGQVTTSWLIKFKNLRNTGLEKVNKQFTAIDKKVGVFEKMTNNAFTNVSRNSTKFFGKMKVGIQSLGAQFPVLGQAIALISNPFVLAAAAVAAIGAALIKATKQAEIFNNEFLELKNLNLDKTTAQINALQESVLNLSLAEGFDPQKTSRAFFDIQSATGRFGKEVELSVQKIGLFSRAVKADFNTSVEGAAKAMGIFGFGARDLDKFLESSFKTVQVGVTTFDQLAKSQVEFAGAAAAAGQGFDEANKLFALFSKTSKSVDIAATLTKTAFEDLTKKSTLEGFRKIGVEVFDINGNMLQLDKIIEQLVPRFKSLSDEKFAALKEEIGGSEGLRGLLDQVKNSGDDVLGTFAAFDSTQFDAAKLLENANNDLTIMKDIVDNQINVLFIKLGENILPGVVKVLGFISDFIKAANTPLQELSGGALILRGIFESIALPFRIFGLVLKAAILSVKLLFGLAEKGFNAIANAISRVTGFIKTAIQSVFEFFGGEGNVFVIMAKQVNRVFDGIVRRFNSLKRFVQEIISDITGEPIATITPPGGGPGGPGGVVPPTISPVIDVSDKVSTGVGEVVGGGARVRNVTVTIGNLVENIVIEVQEAVGEASDEMERQLTEILVRSVRDAEITLSSD